MKITDILESKFDERNYRNDKFRYFHFCKKCGLHFFGNEDRTLCKKCSESKD
jgi:hypothetical protein